MSLFYLQILIQFISLSCKKDPITQDGQTDRQTERQKDRQTERQTYRQTDTQTDTQTDGQTDIRTDRKMDRQTTDNSFNILFIFEKHNMNNKRLYCFF